MKEIENQILIVKNDIRSRFPNCNYTIRILIWDDDTTMVECRYGAIDKLHCSRYYNNELTYEEIELKFGGERMMIDEKGNEYYQSNNF